MLAKQVDNATLTAFPGHYVRVMRITRLGGLSTLLYILDKFTSLPFAHLNCGEVKKGKGVYIYEGVTGVGSRNS